jgi:hypothetical protein
MTTFTTGDISPEHTARATNNNLHPEVGAAYAYVDRVLHTADGRSAFNGAPAWHGWALREAFLAGCSHAATLAQPEPTGLPPGYIDPEHTGADRHMLQVFYRACQSEGGTADEIHLRGIRAVLADAALAQPQPQELRQEAILNWLRNDEAWGTIVAPKSWGAQDDKLLNLLLRAIAHFGRPAIEPVPIAERLPGPEDCDAEGRCWLCGKVEGDWRLINSANSGVPHLKYCFSHWLPAHAIPLPQAGEGEV